MNEKVITLLNEQVNKELYSAYLYLDISNYFIGENLNGFGHWFSVQAQEERDHALLFMQFLQNNRCKVKLTAVQGPDKIYNNFKAPLEAAFEHEQFVTASIHNIYAEALADKDYRTTQFLDWFIKEQGEEEKNSEELIRKYELFGSDGKGLYLLDNELMTRVYTPPTLVL